MSGNVMLMCFPAFHIGLHSFQYAIQINSNLFNTANATKWFDYIFISQLKNNFY